MYVAKPAYRFFLSQVFLFYGGVDQSMVIRKVLNNNAVVALNEKNEEIVVMGKGIAFGKKVGQWIDTDKINKTFELSLKDSQKKLINMLKDIPIEYMEISDQVISKAREELQTKIDDSLYITLTDHIHTSIERYREGIRLKNELLLEIKHFYVKEFELGLWTLALIKNIYDIEMDEDEAGFIAMHIVSSEMGRNMSDTYELTTFIQGILELVKDYFHRDFDESSLAYYRFVTHLKYFGKRIISRTAQSHNESLNNDLLELMKEKYVHPYLCALQIKSLVEKKYHVDLEDEEILFLTIHIAKIISNK